MLNTVRLSSAILLSLRDIELLASYNWSIPQMVTYSVAYQPQGDRLIP
jgi:hypothetical protein